ncbi:hypothetical protein PICSAR48_00169 [Mycobacterium avium subsp. paratuberculosis]|nr:hypothetical protein PICSAR48_00169 [Mycobacterium avium subsp. paratuberculosis]
MVSLTWWSDWVNQSVNWARLSLSATNCCLCWYSAVTNRARLLVMATKSPRPSLSAVSACDRLFRVSLTCLPLPDRLSAADSMMSPNGPAGCWGVGPSWRRMALMESRSWSHSTGTRVRSIGMTAPSRSTGPPV